VIYTGGKQYFVTEGDVLEVELLNTADKAITFEPLLIIDAEKIKVGTPQVSGAKVTAAITNTAIKAEKVTAIRYKSKKRVHKVRGHRQKHAQITISKIID
ncbi:50S ribosomal protein L21, partial [Candidatus Saccharibacteria bacterium]|nr:50S ribosomal protein L21 [Candidatus Saccharibacteria bacterium]